MTKEQIVKLYESSELSTSELAEAFGMEEESIKLALIQGSPKFRELVKADESIFGDNEMQSAVMTMQQLLYAEENTVRFRAAKFIINEKMGRHTLKNVQQVNINVNLFNEKLAKAKEAMKRSKEQQNIVDVEEVAI